MLNQKFGNFWSRKNIQKMDFYGAPVQISIREEQFFSTSIGLLVSFGIVLTCLLIFWQSFIRSIYQERPQVSSTQSSNLESNQIPLDLNNYTMAILLTNLQKKSFDGYGSLPTQSPRCQWKTNKCYGDVNELIIRIIDVRYSKLNHNDSSLVTPSQKAFFNHKNLTNIHCISPNQSNQTLVFLQGTPSSNYFAYLKIQVTQCNNATSNGTCAGIDEINQKLGSGYYTVYMLDNLIDMQQSGNPLVMNPHLYYTGFSNISSKSVFTTYQQTLVDTDTGFIVSTIEEFFGLTYFSDKESQQPSNGQFFVEHTIMLDPKQIIYFRSYQKLFIVFGSLGGLWNVLYYLCFAFMAPLVKKLMYLEIINKTFSFGDENEEEEQNDETASIPKQRSIGQAGKKSFIPSMLRSQTLQQQQSMVSKSMGSQKQSLRKQMSQFKSQIKSQFNTDKVTNMKDIRKYMKQKQSQMQLSLRAVMSLVFCCSHRKQQAQLEYGEQQIVKQLDVIHLLRKLYELEKLKTVLLNEDQLTIFNFLPKPNMPIDLHLQLELDKNKDDKDLESKSVASSPIHKLLNPKIETPQIKVQNAYEAYKRMQASRDKSVLDVKLVQAFDRDISVLFDHIIEKEQINHSNNDLGARGQDGQDRVNEGNEVKVAGVGGEFKESLLILEQKYDSADLSLAESPLCINKIGIKNFSRDDLKKARH